MRSQDMSYQALARTWRPKNFAEVIGQEHVVMALSNALNSQRVHHAFLFAGTRGVGKTTLARIFAKALNCEVGMSATPCGECNICQSVARGNFVDLIEIDAASRTGVDSMRELLDNVQYTPTLGRIKVYLIDEVHMLSQSSFNALLKTLEEPPPHVKFLLATTKPDKLLPTVLSRCIQFNLKSLELAPIGAQLEKILQAEKIAFEPAALNLLARAADGSMRDGLSLLDQAVAYGGGEITAAAIRAMLGLTDEQYLHNLLAAVLQARAADALHSVAEMSRYSVDYANALNELLSLLHNLALLQIDRQAVEAKGIEAAPLAELAAHADAEMVQLLYQIALLGKRDLAWAPDPRSGFEMVVLRMLAFRPTSSGAAEPAATVKTAPRAAPPQPRAANAASSAPHAPRSPNPPNPPNPPSPASAPVTPLSAGDLTTASGWATFVNQCGASGLVQQIMLHIQPHPASTAAQLQLILDPEHAHLAKRDWKEKIIALVTQHVDKEIKIQLDVGTPAAAAQSVGTPSQQQARQREQAQSAAEQAFQADTNVQDMVELFAAEVVAESVQPAANASPVEPPTAPK